MQTRGPMRRAFTLIEQLTVVAIVCVLAAILFPVFARTHCHEPGACEQNLKQLALGTIQYTQDYDDRYPPAATGATTVWGSAIQPYLKTWVIYRCPNDVRASLSTAKTGTSYWYNHRLNALPTKQVVAASQTLLFGEGNWTTNLRYSLDAIPAWWLRSATAPSGRHSRTRDYQFLPITHNVGGGYYVFADGHVKWLQPDQIKGVGDSQTKYSFAP